MSMTLRSFAFTSITRNGQHHHWGSVQSPQKEVTLAGETIQEPRTLTLAAGETKIIWAYTDQLSFSHFELWCMDAGYVNVRGLVDDPTSTTNLAPSGTVNRWVPLGDRSCVSHLILDTDRVWANASASDDAATDANGLPRALTGTGAAAASKSMKLYKIAVKNPSSTAAVTIRFALAH